MLYQQKKLLNDLLFGFFTLFIFGSTFSIALAQVALGISLILFIIIATSIRYNPFVRELRWFYVFIGLYILWMFISSLMGDTPVASIKIMKEEWLFCAVPIGIYVLYKETIRQRFIAAFAIGTGLFALYGLLQFFSGVHWFKSVAPNPGPEFGYVIKGNFPSPMTFGNYFGTAAGFFAGFALSQWSKLSHKSRWLYGGVALIALLATLGSYNRGAILGLIAGVIVLSIVLRHRKLMFSLGAVIILAVALLAAMPAPRERLYNHIKKELATDYEGGRVFIWNNSLKIVAENPVFGVGQGNFRYAYLEYLRDDIPDIRKRVHAHNDFLNISAIAGIPGALFFLGIWISVFCYIRRQWKLPSPYLAAALTGSVIFLVSSLTEATFADEEVRQMLMFIWAVGLFSLFPSPQSSKGTYPPGPE